jgi:hypothetical protein
MGESDVEREPIRRTVGMDEEAKGGGGDKPISRGRRWLYTSSREEEGDSGENKRWSERTEEKEDQRSKS